MRWSIRSIMSLGITYINEVLPFPFPFLSFLPNSIIRQVHVKLSSWNRKSVSVCLPLFFCLALMPAVIHLNANMPAYGIYHMPTGEFYGGLGHTALPISMRIVEYCGSPFSSFETVPNLCSRSWTEIGHGMIKYSVCITQKKTYCIWTNKRIMHIHYFIKWSLKKMSQSLD